MKVWVKNDRENVMDVREGVRNPDEWSYLPVSVSPELIRRNKAMRKELRLVTRLLERAWSRAAAQQFTDSRRYNGFGVVDRPGVSKPKRKSKRKHGNRPR